MAGIIDMHAVLTVCGIGNAAAHTLIIRNEDFNSLKHFTVMESDQDVTDMADRFSTNLESS